MTNKDKYELCFHKAQKITAHYRDECVVDVQNFAASTLAAIAAVVAVVGAGISAYGMYQQGQSQKKVAAYNAQLQQNSAIAARQESEAEAARLRDRANRIRGSQITAASKSGLMLSGSVNDVMYDSSINSELDALTAIYKGQRSANTLNSQAAITRFEGESAAETAMWGAGGTILTGTTQALGYWGQSKSMSQITAAQPKIG